jgi:hypothetical protein
MRAQRTSMGRPLVIVEEDFDEVRLRVGLPSLNFVQATKRRARHMSRARPFNLAKSETLADDLHVHDAGTGGRETYGLGGGLREV